MEDTKCRLCGFKSSAASHLKCEELDTLGKNCALAEFKPGDIIFKQNALSSNVIYIRTGFVKIHMQGPERETILKISKAPTYLGLPTTFGDRVNNYSATALSELTACFIDINAFRDFIYQNGNFAYEIILELCRNELGHFHRCVNLTQKQLNGRIADALLFMANEIFQKDEFELILNRNELSDLVHSSRESVSRVLTQFHEEKLIDLQTKHIHLLNRKSLEMISRNG